MSQSRIQILLAEDNAGDVYLVRRALDKHMGSYELVVATDGSQAMEVVDQAEADDESPCPDFILLDLNLPRCSGARVLERVRNSRRCSHVPVIIVTSSDSPQDKAEIVRLGADHYFRKPTDLANFMKLGELVKEVARKMRNGVPRN